MKNLPLSITLSLVTLMGTVNVANSGTTTEEIPATESSAIVESAEETTAEGINIKLEDPSSEAEAEASSVVEGSEPMGGGENLENGVVGTEEDADLEANEINNLDANPALMLPEADSAEITTDEEAAEVVDSVE